LTRTIHGLNNLREVRVLEAGVLKLQRTAQTPGGADSDDTPFGEVRIAAGVSGRSAAR